MSIAVGFGLSLQSPVSADPGKDWSALLTASASAPDASVITSIAQELSAVLPAVAADSAADDLEAAAGVYAALVGRGQEIDLPLTALGLLVELAGRLEHRVRARREQLEETAGEDEALLESLYRSDRWRQLSSSGVEISFWLGWAQLARVQRGLEGAERETALAEAERAFARAARALAFPDLALRGLLGLGIARRLRGDRLPR